MNFRHKMNLHFGWKPVVALIGLAVVAVSAQMALAKGMPTRKEEGSPFTVAPQAKLGPLQAMKIAAKASGGKPFQATFEYDEGHWVYGVMVKKGKQILEVELNPVTGKVGDIEKVTPEGEAKEVRSELGKILKG